MLSSLKIKLDNIDEIIGYNWGSLFQGVLMENIDSQYADKLHKLKVNPYSQYIKRSKEGTYWIISTTNREAYEKIISPILEVDKVVLKNKNLEIKIADKFLNIIKREEFIEKNLFDNNNKQKIIFNFLTPTAFKKDGIYVILPEPELIFQNLIRKFDESGDETIFSHDLLNEIKKSTFISRYNLKSRLFYLEKTVIPGFIGNIEIKTETNKAIKNILKLLNDFSEFSGTGIKSSIGMGATIAGGEKLG